MTSSHMTLGIQLLWVRDTLRHTVITLGVLNVFRSEANGRDLSNYHDAVNEETNYECFWVVETSVTDPLVFKDICAGVDRLSIGNVFPGIEKWHIVANRCTLLLVKIFRSLNISHKTYASITSFIMIW